MFAGLMLCKRCDVLKPITEFYQEPRNRSGVQGTCKQCVKSAASLWQKDHPEQAKERQREWRTKNADRHRANNNASNQRRMSELVEKNRARRAENPAKYKARAAILHLVRTGQIKRPSKCARCNKPGHRIEAHHEDYYKPLDVEWLCSKCHKAHHAALKVS